jgi:hypothetical protein
MSKLSKIPQNEWGTIAKRHSQGETLVSIARSYGCTAPAIHYFLKRNATCAAPVEESVRTRKPVAAKPAVQAPETTMPTTRASMPARAPDVRLSMRQGSEAKSEHPSLQRGALGAIGQRPITAAGRSGGIGRAAGLTAALDPELRANAEAAIEMFRAAFDKALAEGSSPSRERLRQATSDLMRVAARTTIVIDRLEAKPKRT